MSSYSSAFGMSDWILVVMVVMCADFVVWLQNENSQQYLPTEVRELPYRRNSPPVNQTCSYSSGPNNGEHVCIHVL